jgi:hypothetical protein
LNSLSHLIYTSSSSTYPARIPPAAGLLAFFLIAVRGAGFRFLAGFRRNEEAELFKAGSGRAKLPQILIHLYSREFKITGCAIQLR